MTYKDPDKQREANRQAQAKFKAKGITKGKDEGITITTKGITDVEIMQGITKPEQEAIEKACCSEGVTGGDDALPKRSSYKILNDGPITIETPPKRGKDIKVFADLPPHVQETINILSDDKTEHKRRTAIAINYQHQFPDRYHSTGVAI